MLARIHIHRLYPAVPCTNVVRLLSPLSPIASQKLSSVSKSLLSKLRRETGYTFSVCREALVKYNNDFDAALHWLNEEAVRRGWSKAGKLAGRQLSQGLVGVLGNKSKAVVIEANCETDFVSRNNEFQNLVATVAEVVFNQYASDAPHCNWTQQDLSEMTVSSSSKLNDVLAVAIGAVGENMGLRRAIGLQTTNELSRLAWYAHSNTAGIGQGVRDVKFGKYAAIMRYRPIGEQAATAAWHEQAARLGKQVCQHIVGMNPVPSLDPESCPVASDPDDEHFLLRQPFFLDETVTVGEHLLRNEMLVEDFVRLECGEELDTNCQSPLKPARCQQSSS